MMRGMSERPIVSFARDGQVFELGRSGQSPVLHMYGSTGLGLAPVSFASSDRLAGDGSIVRGVRYDSREVFIPLFMAAESMGALSRMRRELNGLLAPHRGMVDVRIQDPATGTDRMVRGYLKDGLDGDFGTEYYGSWQKLGLTFECPDPWWLGPEHVSTLRLNPGSKPFLSEGKISRRNLVPNPFGPGATDVDYWRPMRCDLTAAVVDGEFAARATKDSTAGFMHVDPSRDFTPGAGSTFRFSVDVKVETATRVWLRSLTYGGAQIADDSGYVEQSPGDGWVRHTSEVTVEAMPEDGYLRSLIYVADLTEGEDVWVRRVLVEVDPPTDAPYFDGDSVGCKWVSGGEGPESIMWDPEDTTPFFPVVLAESAVVGEFTVTIDGDGAVPPAWEIHGPGEDLRIVRGRDRIAVDGEIRAGESLLIDTAAGRITPDRWEDVSLDSRLFQLEPGTQTVTVTMVGATTDTEVRMSYRERHLEGL